MLSIASDSACRVDRFVKPKFNLLNCVRGGQRYPLQAQGDFCATADIQKLEDIRSSASIGLSGIDSALAGQKQKNARIAELPGLIKAAADNLDKQSRCYTYIQGLVNRVEEKTISLLIPESQKSTFKLYLSLIYAVIVSFLIIGFFAISFRDEVISRSIFSQQVGIQFITLFSLVIAIILFGILGACPRKKPLKNNALELRGGDLKISHFPETRVLTGDQNFLIFSKNI